MHALVLLMIAALIYAIAYRYYSAFLAAKVLVTESERPTPAQQRNDGRDYLPTNRWVLLGHHFAAISGAGPLIGPVLAAQFGYMPGFLWMLIGVVLAGATHDMMLLFASVRHNGESMLGIAKRELGPFAGWITSIAVLFLVTITMAGASISIVNALERSPWGTFTVGVTIPISIFIGLYLKYLRPGKIVEATIIGVTLILAGVVFGAYIPQTPLGHLLTLNRQQLSIMIPTYAFLAAGLPVWLLLLPRDYLSSYIKVGTMVLLVVGMVVANPVILMPAMTKFAAGNGPIISGSVWPYLFITISCGALSGYHAIVCSGTTPKMVARETDIRLIGFGAMLIESLVALTALLTVTVIAPGDYFAINATPAVFANLGYQVSQLPLLSQLTGEQLAGKQGGATALAVGMTSVFNKITRQPVLISFWYHFAIAFQALFILTLIDAGTRAARYLLQEIGGHVCKPLRDHNWLPGVLATSGLFCLAWGYLLNGGTISTIWPLFGVSNQIIGGMALAIGTTMLIRAGKVRYCWTTVIPMVFLLITASYAGVSNILRTYLPAHNYLLTAVSALMLVMGVLVIGDAVRTWIGLLSAKQEQQTTAPAAVPCAIDA